MSGSAAFFAFLGTGFERLRVSLTQSTAASTACWHTALPHLGGPDRRVVIMGWQSSRTVPNPMLSAAHVERLEASGRMTPTLRQLVGAQEA